MTKVKLKIAELRKKKGIGQQELAEEIGVSFQSVSKWETGTTMPDIALLPGLAEYFDVTVDELLGLKPLPYENYMPRNSDERDGWNGKTDKLYKNRKYFWNEDYLAFLVKEVWKIEEPVKVIDFRCCEGYIGRQLLKILPKGSSYTGIDNEYFTQRAKADFEKNNFKANFVASDIYSFKTSPKYDIAICQAGLRHMNRPQKVLEKMVDSVKTKGLVVCVEINREFENDGLYIDGLDYDKLCTGFDFHKVWRKELEQEGRDYAVGMRIPFYMEQLGLHDVDVRMNDKIMYINPKQPDYEERLQDFLEINGWDQRIRPTEWEPMIELFMNRGLSRSEAEAYFKNKMEITEFFKADENKKSVLKVQGLLISYGRK